MEILLVVIQPARSTIVIPVVQSMKLLLTERVFVVVCSKREFELSIEYAFALSKCNCCSFSDVEFRRFFLWLVYRNVLRFSK